MISRRWWSQLRPGLPGIEQFVTLDEKIPQADFTYEELLARGRPRARRHFSFDENSTAELFYTSGSTGTPKGVMLSHRTLYLHALSVAATFNHDDRTWSCTPSRCSMPTAGDVRKLRP